MRRCQIREGKADQSLAGSNIPLLRSWGGKGDDILPWVVDGVASPRDGCPEFLPCAKSCGRISASSVRPKDGSAGHQSVACSVPLTHRTCQGSPHLPPLHPPLTLFCTSQTALLSPCVEWSANFTSQNLVGPLLNQSELTRAHFSMGQPEGTLTTVRSVIRYTSSQHIYLGHAPTENFWGIQEKGPPMCCLGCYSAQKAKLVPMQTGIP